MISPMIMLIISAFQWWYLQYVQINITFVFIKFFLIIFRNKNIRLVQIPNL
eukprot:UN00027